MARRSSSDSFPSRGGEVSWAYLKRQLIALGVMLAYFVGSCFKVRKDNISSLVADYPDRGFMR
jgi:hypothetical protein